LQGSQSGQTGLGLEDFFEKRASQATPIHGDGDHDSAYPEPVIEKDEMIRTPQRELSFTIEI
jgi:hypothetical protein